MPESTRPDTASFSLISQTVFAQKFELVAPAKEGGLSTGALIGVIAGPVVAFLLLVNFAIFFMLRRRKVRKIREAEANRATIYPPIDPIVPQTQSEPPPTPHELASPEIVGTARSPHMSQINWVTSPGSSPPAYDSQRNMGSIGPAKLKIPEDPQELEGSTYIHQHHPAFAPDPTGTPSTPTTAVSPPGEPPRTPETPARSQEGRERDSPLVTPSSGPAPRSPPAISPPDSPRHVLGRMG